MGIGSPDFNPLMAIDIETTGPDPLIHEIVELYIIPISASFSIDTKNYPIMLKMRPQMLEIIESQHNSKQISDAIKYGVEPMAAADALHEWFETLYYDRQILPLSWNYRNKQVFIEEWLGKEIYNQYFDINYRDLMEISRFISDRHLARGDKSPFSRLTMTALIEYIEYEGDFPDRLPTAYQRVMAYPQIYRKLLMNKYIV